jgi:2-iminobutanoate/2-iminopropanoate deaminase
MHHRAIQTDDAPSAIGPYSQAIEIQIGEGRKLVFTAGQIALDPATMEIVEGGVAEQTRRVMANLTAVLAAAGTGWANVVKTTIHLADMGDFGAVNEVYGQAVADPPPSRSTVAVKELPRGALVEIDVVALA